MPIEIRELVIRAIVDPTALPQPDGGTSATVPDRAGHAALVQECVAEVMRQLRRAEEP